MKTDQNDFKELFLKLLGRWWIVLALIVLLPIYVGIAVNNERTVDYVNNGFFTFWLSGRLLWLRMDPYSAADWVNSHYTYNATWIPETIFPYPLPLSIITAPLGLFPIKTAYILWGTTAQLIVAGCILWLANQWEGLNRQLFAVFVLAATILNGNVFLGLMTGTFITVFLFFLVLALFFLENRRPMLAGIALASLVLKPPLLVITALIGAWLLLQRNWKAIGGMAAGWLGWLAIGLAQDPTWIQKFLGMGASMLSKRVGNQPTILSYTRLFCNGEMNCALTAYAALALLLVGLYTYFLWKRRKGLSALEVFSLAAALGVMLPPYLWSYDYTLLIIPVCYIVFELIRRYKTYGFSTLFLLLLDGLSITGMILFWMNPNSEALTVQRDMWSIWVGVLVLGMTAWLVWVNKDKTR